MTDTFRSLCAEVLAYNNGEKPYNFSSLSPYDRDNAAFDAWQDIKQRLKDALSQPEPQTLTDEELKRIAWRIHADAQKDDTCGDLTVRVCRTIYDLGRQHATPNV